MSPHLRIVSSSAGPAPVTELQTFSFAQVEGDLVIMHDDKRLTAAEALLELTRLLMPALARPGGAVAGAPIRLMPGEMGGFELTEDCPPCVLIADQVRRARFEKPLFGENRHQLGYPINGPVSDFARPKRDGR